MKLKHLMLILATIAGFSSVKAADTTTVPDGWTYVKFNPDVRYSQWVLDSRLGDFYSNSTKRPFQLFDADGKAVPGTAYDKNTRFDYVPGLVAKATIEARDLYKEFDWSKPWFYTIMNYGTKYTYTEKVSKLADKELTLDDMNAAKMYFGVANDALATQDNKALVNEQIDKIVEKMKVYNDIWAIGGKNSTNTIGDAVKGGWFHKPEYVDQMWGDGLYMGAALLAQIINYKGTVANVTANDWDLITRQFTISWNQMYNESNGLLYHAFTANPESAKAVGWKGVGNGVYHSAAHWGRACGWYFLALVDVLEQMQIAKQETTGNYATLKSYLQKLATGLANYQDEATGCWYQVVDEKDAPLSGNYLESSCTAIFSAAYLKGARLGVLDKATFEAVGKKAYEGCVNNFMMRDTEGKAQLIHCCASAGLGGKDNRSGSRDYYINGSDVTQRNTYTEGKVLGGFILAATEYERLNNKQNAPMLLIDLQPSYAVANGETANLEVKVSGATSTSYQWFKGNWNNSEKIEGATAATYNPTVSGTYFCEVIADNSSAAKSNAAARAATTIRSSVTEVTVAEGTEGGDEGTTTPGESIAGTISWTDMAKDAAKADADGVASSGIGSAVIVNSGVIKGLSANKTVEVEVAGGASETLYRYTGFTATQDDTKYFEYSYSINDGYTFTPSKVSISWAPSGGKAISFAVYTGTSDSDMTLVSTLTHTKDKVYGTDEITLSGSYTKLRLVPYGKEGGSIVLDNIVIEGVCRAIVPSESQESDLMLIYKNWYDSNNNTWTPVAGSGILLENIVSSSSKGKFSISGNGANGQPVAELAYVSEDTKKEHPYIVVLQSGTVTLTQDEDATYAAGSVKINIAIGNNVAKDGTNSFSFPTTAETVVSDGMTITREDIKMTFGNDGFWGKAGTKNGYTNGQVMPLGVDNSPYIPTAGTFYKFTPAKDGSLAVKVNLGADKALHISEEGNLIVAKTGDGQEIGQGTPLTEKYTGNVTFEVKAGKEYYVYAVGSKLGFNGFEFTPAPPVLNVKFDKASVTYYKDEQASAVVAPKLVVMYDEKELGKDKYTVAYSSSDESVVKVTSGDEPTIVGVGSAVITATVTPKDTEYGTNTLTAQYKFTVRDFDAPVVRAYPLTVYNTTGVQPMPVIDIYAHDHEQLVNLDKRYYTLKYEWKSGDKIVDTTGGGFVLDGEESNWTLGQAVVNVTVTPTEEAAKRFRISETTTDFRVVVIEAGAKLVPTFGGVSTGRMTTNNTTEGREFITPVIYNGVDISSGFDVIYEITDNGGTGSKLKNASNGKVTSSGSKINDNVRHTVTLLSGSKDGKVTIKVTAKPTKDYASQYQEITKEIKVEVNSLLKKFSGVTINPATLDLQVGNVYTDFEVEVKDEQGNVMTDGYTLEWVSTVPGVAAIKDREKGGVRTLFDGTTRIMAFVKHPEYSDMRAVCVLTVTDPGMFKVSGNTKYAVGTEMGNENITVTLGGWMFNGNTQELFRPYGTTTEGMGGDLWGAPTTSTKKPVGFTHNIGMGDMKNARQENGSNCRPECKELYNATMVEQDYKLLDKMFNVPCYGSYIALSPKTNGKVTVYVRQNGVFDKSDGSAVYRPQRRLFVMDEMGNFVPSTPKMEYPTPWGDNGIVESDKAKITCDLFKTKDGSNNFYEIAKEKFPKDEQTTAAQNFVKSHFVGLNNFSTANFQNGVYASALPYDLVKNPLIKGKSGDDKGLTESTEELAKRGWSVLSVAPVSYTFDIKAGKTYYVYNFGSKLGFYGYKFRQADVTVKEYDWKQAEVNTVENTDQYHVAKVSIDREFKAGTWAVCVLPFSMNRLQINEVFGHVYDKNAPEGTQIMYFDRVEGTTIHFVRHAYNTIVAGKPFLIRPTKDAKITSENMGNFPYVTIEAAGKPAEWGRQNDLGYSWVSDYSPQTFSYGDYYLSNTGDMKRMTGNSNTLEGFRSFLKAKTESARAKVLKVSSSNNVDPDDVSTAIEGLMMDSDGNLFEVPVSGTVYSLSGQVVTTDATKLYSLPAGIYVVNGRKYVVK